MSSTTKAGTFVCVVAVMFGCDGGSTSGPFVVRDSAGVTIVESTTPLWDEGEGWTVRAEPEVVIGRSEGDERYVLDRVLGARRFSDGRIAILDLGSSRVRVYDADGQHLFDAGGGGRRSRRVPRSAVP